MFQYKHLGDNQYIVSQKVVQLISFLDSVSFTCALCAAVGSSAGWVQLGAARLCLTFAFNRVVPGLLPVPKIALVPCCPITKRSTEGRWCSVRRTAAGSSLPDMRVISVVVHSDVQLPECDRDVVLYGGLEVEEQNSDHGGWRSGAAALLGLEEGQRNPAALRSALPADVRKPLP